MNHRYIQRGGKSARGKTSQGAKEPGGKSARMRTSQGAKELAGEQARGRTSKPDTLRVVKMNIFLLI